MIGSFGLFRVDYLLQEASTLGDLQDSSAGLLGISGGCCLRVAALREIQGLLRRMYHLRGQVHNFALTGHREQEAIHKVHVGAQDGVTTDPSLMTHLENSAYARLSTRGGNLQDSAPIVIDQLILVVMFTFFL